MGIAYALLGVWSLLELAVWALRGPDLEGLVETVVLVAFVRALTPESPPP
jgi:hypothetical protein